ncbi:MAG: hypothetical protein GC201_04880 [Alphaproteobacteria bacterium]|nr:hypothetical protein [Alphaproteobacteria bacterium]
MTERATLEAISRAVLYLEQDAKLVGAESVAMYLRLAVREADSAIREMDGVHAGRAEHRVPPPPRSAPAE